MTARKTNHEFIEELKKSPFNIININEYKGSNEKHIFRCKDCGGEFETTPKIVLRRGCRICNRKRNKNRTKVEFESDLLKVNNKLEVVSYSRYSDKTKIRCVIHDYEWDVFPSSLLQGHGCPKCSKVYRRTHEEFVWEMNKINPKISILGKYINARTKISCKCKIDGHEWFATPDKLLSGKNGCCKCGGIVVKITHDEFVVKITHDEFVTKLKELTYDKIEIIKGRYINARTELRFRCKKDGHEWNSSASNILYGKGERCPKCSKVYRRTHGEFVNEIKQKHDDAIIVLTKKITSTSQKCKFKCTKDGHVWERM